MSDKQKFLVVGTPIDHSLSPKLHNAVYHKLDLNRSLEAYDPKNTTGFRQLISELCDGAYQGVCVTIPYKLQAYNVCDYLTATAQSTGAVNYIRREADGSLTGDNTDAQGFAQAAERGLNIDFNNITAVVCGSGGASRAIVHALLQGGAARVALVSRDAQGTAKQWNIPDFSLAQIVQASPDDKPGSESSVQALDYKTLLQSNTHFDLLVNATPLGMKDDRMPVATDWLRSNVNAVYDAVYRREGTTPLVTAARTAAIPAEDGRSMLIEQAVCGMHFWGIEADSTPLRSIMDAVLG